MKNLAKAIVVASALFGAGLVGPGAANAMPVAPAVGAQTATAPIETINWPCGPGWHANPWGRCVPNRYYRPYYRPYYHPYYRRHWHRRYW
jgi:hypothetical protein